MKFTLATALAAVPLASAHFGVDFPWWRGDTLAENTTFNQWVYPCGAVPATMGNRTAIPLTGGVSLKLELHHAWTYIFVNLGLGDNVTSNFNISLTPSLTNTTGKGNLCIPNLPYPASFKPTEGQTGSIQVVTSGETGSALYNCADVVFRANATAFGGQKCETTANLTMSTVTAAGSTSSGGSGNGTGTGSGAAAGGTTKPAAGVANNANMALLSSVVGLAVVFGLGSSL